MEATLSSGASRFQPYAVAWREGDLAKRLALLRQVCRDDVTFSGPPLRGVAEAHLYGVERLSDYIDQSFDHWHERYVEVHSFTQPLQTVQFTWRILSQDGGTLEEGSDLAHVDESGLFREIQMIPITAARRSPSPAPPSDLSGFSTSVRDAATELPSDTLVSAAALAEQLQRKHPEYGERILGTLSLSGGAVGPQRATARGWLAEVRELYDAQKVKLIDGGYLVYGLALLDGSLAHVLIDSGCLDALEREMLERPIPDTNERVASVSALLTLGGRQRRRADALRHVRDLPTDVDTLNREAFANSLAIRLRNLEEERGPFIVHLYGPWGSGKSSLLKLLRKALAREDPPWVVVDFNAWQHQRAGSPWWWLLDAVYAESGRHLDWRRRILHSWFPELWWRFRVGWAPTLIATALLVTGAWAAYALGLVDNLTHMKDLAQTLSAITALLTTTFLLMRGFGRLLLTGATSPAQNILFTRDPMNTLTRHFADLVRRLTPRKVAIFIDDLDRCQAGYVVELLEGIQTLFNQAQVVYVVAADRHWLRAAFEDVYKAYVEQIGEGGRPLGYLFLDKVFQLSSPVPYIPADVQRNYWEGLLGLKPKQQPDTSATASKKVQEMIEPADTSAEMRRTLESIDDPMVRSQFTAAAVQKLAQPAAQQLTENMLRPFAHLLEANPRAMKRLVNAFGVRDAIDFLAGGRAEQKQLALWTILELRWPLLAEYLAANPESVASLLSDDTATPDPVPDAGLQPLFADTAVRQVVRGERIGVALDAAAIRACAGLEPRSAVTPPEHPPSNRRAD